MKVGDKIDDYLLIKSIPGGGMAYVFEVEKDDCKYVLKTLKEPNDELLLKRFQREVRLMESVKDVHVIDIVHSNLDGTEPYYIMPLCECSLDDQILKLTDDELLERSIQFCEGINAIHRAEITHRDINPKNALIIGGVVKITDLGLGRFENRDSTTITQIRDAWGTPGYCPPEFRHTKGSFLEGSVQSDIFMIGKSLYRILGHGADPLNMKLSKVPPVIGLIIDKCTEDEPKNRYENVGKIIDELNKIKIANQQFEMVPKSFDETLKSYGKIRNSGFAADVYRYLCLIGKDNKDMAKSLKMLTEGDLRYVFLQKKEELSSFVDYFDESIRNCVSWIQFDDIDDFVKTASVLIPLCDNMLDKQKMLEFCIDYAHNYTRWPAMAKVGEILEGLSENEIKNMYPFLMTKKEELKDFSKCFGEKIKLHRSVEALIKGR